MMRMIQSTSAGHAKDYFNEELSRSDYYMDGQELAGRFQGRLAERLGLTVTATKEQFHALCDNLNPKTGKNLTLRNNDVRTVAYDINFHCPKSLSILNALSGDSHLTDAFQDSVSQTMREIEKDSKTRVRKNGQYADRDTGELVWAEFIHQTSRPTEDQLPDPHLHCHAVVFNATWDQEEQKFKAGQFRDIMRDMPYYQARFHKRLADRLEELGYSIRRTDKAFEIEGVPQKVLDLFSKRTNEIGQVAKEKGITDDRRKSELGARTRAKKQKGLTMAELKADWKRQIKDVVQTGSKEGDTIIRYAKNKNQLEISPKQCVDHSIQHSFERVSVMAERRLLAQSYRHAIGSRSAQLDEITSAFKNDERIIQVIDKGRAVCTTRHVLAEEKRMVEIAMEGKGKMIPLYTHGELPSMSLNDLQQRAVSHILTTSDSVSIIRGAAGTGKTTLMKEANRLMEMADKKVIVLAPTSQASRGVLREEGFKEAETVSKFLLDQEMQQQIKDQVLWIDEAGLLGTQDMIKLLRIAQDQNARLILGGDTRQHSSVTRGDALRILNTVANIQTAEVSKIYRQKDIQYRDAVEDLSKGNVESAFTKLDDIGAIKVIDPLEPHQALVEDYMKVIKQGKSALVISPTHQHGEVITQAIREKLQDEGLIGKREIQTRKLTNLNLTQAQKSDCRSYQEGQHIQFNQNCKGIKRGSLWKVSNRTEKEIYIEDGNGKETILPIEKSLDFDVYQENKMALAKGDKIIISKNSFDQDNKRLNNGHSLEVVSVDPKGDVILTNPTSQSLYRLKNDFGHWTHAHCITSYASQGKTVDEVFIAQPSATFPATDAKQFYVSVSRGRDKVHIYTDDKAELLEHASHIGDRQSALELVKPNSGHLKMIEQQLRQPQLEFTRNSPFKGIHHPLHQIDRDYEPGL